MKIARTPGDRDMPHGIEKEYYKTVRTHFRCRAAAVVALVLAAALVAGTYINARWGGPTSITVSADDPDDSPSPPPMFPKHEKDAEKGGSI